MGVRTEVVTYRVTNKHGLIDANPYRNGAWSLVWVTIKGKTDEPVRVTGLDIEVHSREPMPVAGAVLTGQCGGEVEGRYALFDLEQDPPAVIESSNDIVLLGNAITPLRFPYEVSNTELETLLIIGQARDWTKWTGRLSWTNGEESGTLGIDDGGAPYQTGRQIRTPNNGYSMVRI